MARLGAATHNFYWLWNSFLINFSFCGFEFADKNLLKF